MDEQFRVLLEWLAPTSTAKKGGSPNNDPLEDPSNYRLDYRLRQ
jgi:hypothetical protein